MSEGLAISYTRNVHVKTSCSRSGPSVTIAPMTIYPREAGKITKDLPFELEHLADVAYDET